MGKLIAIALGLMILMGNWAVREVPPGRFPVAHAAQGNQPLFNARDELGRFVLPRGRSIRQFDGEVGPEWDDANLLTVPPFHDVNDESRTFPTRIWVKHDGRDLYFACEVELPSAWNDFWFFIALDKDGDRSVLTEGVNDDYLQVPAKGQTVPRPTDLHYDSTVERFVPDVNKGGTNDIAGRGRETRSGSTRIYRIEGRHPLDSRDDRFDVSWRVGQTVGFLFGFVGLGGGTDKAGGGNNQLIAKRGDEDNADQGILHNEAGKLKLSGRTDDVDDLVALINECQKVSPCLVKLIEEINKLPDMKMVMVFVGRDIVDLLGGSVTMDAFRQVPRDDSFDELIIGEPGTGTIDLDDFEKLPSSSERAAGRTTKGETIPTWATDRCQMLSHVLGEYLESAKKMLPKEQMKDDYHKTDPSTGEESGSHVDGGLAAEQKYREEQRIPSDPVAQGIISDRRYGGRSEYWERDDQGGINRIRYTEPGDSGMIFEKDPVFIGVIVEIGPDPGFFSGGSPALQRVRFQVQHVIEGGNLSPGDTIDVLHLLIPGAPGNFSDKRGLDPALFQVGSRLQERIIGTPADPPENQRLFIALEVQRAAP
jgi:hypothetical protein